MAISVYPWHETQWRQILQRKAALPHALLFKGGEGIGKIDFVRRLAQSLACISPAPDGAACGECQACRWFAAGNHPDYRELVPETMRPDGVEEALAEGRKPRTEITVAEVRRLEDFINLTAGHQNGKSIVIYPAEKMNLNAANALLKSLEEPPPETRFMLVAHRLSYLPPTIVSRCQQFVLATPEAAVAERWLRGQGMAEPELSLAQTGNAPLAALALDDGEFWSQRKTLIGGLAAPKFDALALAEQAREFPVARLLGWLQRWTYDLLSEKLAGRVRYNPDFGKLLAQIASALPAIDIARYHHKLVRQQRIVSHPLNPRLFIEQILLSYSALLRGVSSVDDDAG